MTIFTGSADDDIFNGDDESDEADGGAGSDHLSGGGGSDTLTGGAGADSLDGGDGDDVLFSGLLSPGFGYPFNNGTVFDTGVEIDTLVGGNGSDNIFAGYGDNVDGGEDGDYGDYLNISFLGATSGVTADFRLATLHIGGGVITDIENLTFVQGSNFDDDINLDINSSGYSAFTLVYGMGGNDRIAGGYYTGEIYGGEGDDVLDGRHSLYYLSVIDGGNGNDTLFAGTSAASYGGAGDDVIEASGNAHGGSGNDLIIIQQSLYEDPSWGDAGDDEIRGAPDQANILFGGDGADLLTGGSLDDVLVSGNTDAAGGVVDDMGLERDHLSGLGGSDNLSAGYGDDVDGGTGTDILRLSLGGLTAGIAFDTAGIVSGQPFTLGGGVIRRIETLAYLRGTNFNDVLTLATQSARLTVNAGDGNDVITSSNSSVSVQGGAGNDRFVSGSAGDTFDGGAGNDTIDYSAYSVGVTVNLTSGTGAGGDTFSNVENVIGSAFNDTIVGSAGDNLMIGGAGYNTVSFATATRGVTVDLGITTAQQTIGAGVDTLSGFGFLRGSAFGDTLTGDSEANFIVGGDGDDLLAGRGGADIIDGGAGTDTVTYAGAASGVVINLQMSIYQDGDGASDSLASIENLIGSNFDDRLTGGPDANVLRGGAGDDTLSGGVTALNTLYGGSGNDTFVLDLADTILESVGDGVDTVQLRGLHSYVLDPNVENVTIVGSGDYTVTGDALNNVMTGGTGIDTLSYATAMGSVAVDLGLTGTQRTGGAGLDTISGFENLIGSAFNDRLTGNSVANTLSGGDGDDVLAGRGWNDILNGGTGTDTADYAAALRGVIANLATQTVSNDGDDASDTLVSIENISGSTFYDVMTGDAGSNVLVGNGGGDSLTGGAGADTFRYVSRLDSTAAAQDVIQDFTTGSDRLDLASVNTSSVSIIRDNNGNSFIFAQTPAGDPQMQIAAVGAVNASDVVYNNLHGIYMIGSGLGETLIGSALNDPLQGNGGDDILIGGVGGDAISGGAGADRFVYRSTSESVADGGRYDNLYDFQTGVDVIDMTAINTSTISIIRSGGSSFVFSDTAQGAFQLIAAGREINGNDFLYNNAHGIYLVGSSAAESLIGSANNDSIQGGDGADLLVGGLGGDAISGGAGADNFYYRSVAESTATNNAYDNLYDFQSGTDKIDLTALNTTSISVIRSGGSSFVFAQAPGGNFQLISAGQLLNGDDFTYASSHGIFLVGTADNETFRGSVKADSIQGGDGTDILIGGLGGDALDGGAGADTYRYVSANDSTSSDSDRILSFTTGVDKLDLSAVRTGAADQINILYSGGGSFIFVDLGGNGTNDLVIQSTAVINMTDIVWTAPAAGPDVTEKGFDLADPAAVETAAAVYPTWASLQGDATLTVTDRTGISAHHALDEGWWM